jgi:hypothetical protein
MYKAKVAVCSDIPTKYSTQSEHHVEFFKILNLVVSKETARLLKVKSLRKIISKHLQLLTSGILWSPQKKIV